MKKSVLMLFLVLISNVAYAESGQITAQKLYNNCTLKKNKSSVNLSILNRGFCSGYFTGLIDSENVVRNDFAKFEHNVRIWNLPSNATAGQLEKIFIKYADDHPEYMHKDSSVVVNDALNKAFPFPSVP